MDPPFVRSGATPVAKTIYSNKIGLEACFRDKALTSPRGAFTEPASRQKDEAR